MVKVLMTGYIELERDPRVLREAKALIEKGIDVEVITLTTKENLGRNEIEGIPIHRISLNRKMSESPANYFMQYLIFFVLAFWKTISLSLKNQYDYYYYHNIPDFLVFIALPQKIFGRKKVILDIHDPMSYSLQSKINKNQKSSLIRFVRLVELLSWIFSDILITVNQRCKELIETRLKFKKDVLTVLNLPDKSIFKSSDIPTFSNFENRTVLLYCGTLTAWYGLDVAIRGLTIIKREIPDVLLCIIGTGTELNKLMDLIKNENLESSVLILNSMPQKELVPYIYNCSFGITTHLDVPFSKIYFSTKVAEFLYCDKMVICARTEGILDYFCEEDLYYFTPGDHNDFAMKVIQAKKNPEELNLKMMSAKQKSEQLNWEYEKSKLVSIFK